MSEESINPKSLAQMLYDYVSTPSELRADKLIFSDNCLPLEFKNPGLVAISVASTPFKNVLPSFSSVTPHNGDGRQQLMATINQTVVNFLTVEKEFKISGDLSKSDVGKEIVNDTIKYMALILENGIKYDCVKELMAKGNRYLSVDQQFGIVNQSGWSMVDFVTYVENYTRINKSVDPDTIIFPASIPLMTKLPGYNIFKTSGFLDDMNMNEGVDLLSHDTVVYQKFYIRWATEGPLGSWIYDIGRNEYVFVSYETVIKQITDPDLNKLDNLNNNVGRKLVKLKPVSKYATNIKLLLERLYTKFSEDLQIMSSNEMSDNYLLALNFLDTHIIYDANDVVVDFTIQPSATTENLFQKEYYNHIYNLVYEGGSYVIVNQHRSNSLCLSNEITSISKNR
jgi:hypothetical protein